MKFRCERDVLGEALATAARAAQGRAGSQPVLAGVRLILDGSRLEISGTDLELTIQRTIDVNGERDGSCVVPGRLTAEAVRTLAPGAVVVDAGGDTVEITGDRSSFTVRPFSIDDFPRLGQPADAAVTLPASMFLQAVGQVERAASKDESRPILTGVLLTSEDEGLRLVATDSYRLAVCDLPEVSVLASGQKVLLPSRALRELERALPAVGEITLRLGERDATFESSGTRISTRLIEGEFPNYRQLIPSSYPNRVRIDREALLDALRRVRVMAADATPVRLTIEAEEVRLNTVNQDQGSADAVVEAQADGTPLTVAFNPQYLADGVEATTGDEVVLDTLDALKPAVVRPVDRSDYLYLLMPVRVP
ncbi:MAG TPA: DNA polymerase III subunit beta [Acidimicrobiales bacterium]|nr:DNA polymerase III subunit beta [Acidimicrobiales bacterium]